MRELERKNILITGATGLIGTAIVRHLLSNADADYDIYAVGRNEQRAHERFAAYEKDSRFHFLCHDVTQPLQENITFHYIIHAASNASPSFFANNPVDVMMSNILGTKNLLDYGRQHNMERFLFVSTGEIYGQGDGREFEETYQGYVDIGSARSCYPMSKRATETLCAAYAEQYGVNFVIARPTHVYGAEFTNEDNRVFAQFIRNVLKREDIIMKSSGEQLRSWCSVDDCAEAIVCILQKGKSGEAYNVADPESNYTIRELAEMIASIAGCKVIMQSSTEEEKKVFNPVDKSVFSTKKIEALGWKAKGNMYENIKAIISCLRND